MSRKGAVPSPSVAALRCAVYTRKSSDEGLEQSFNSLHAQRDACEAYVRSQVSEGWSCLPAAYDDGGISGATMERPGLKALLVDVAAGRIDVVVVYKVDRLTRSLSDFARIVEAFDKAGVSFVSVTQAFNTTTSMGRLTLNVLLSFAQFEREVTGERIRDKIALSKAKGMWMGGSLPLGYDVRDHVLIENPAEAETVRRIFKRYLKLGSVHRLREQLHAEGVRSKAWTSSSGRAMGGALLSRGALFYLLQNRHYIGEITHGDRTYPGLHAGIVELKLFEAVQKKLASNRVVRRKRADKPAQALLTGKLFDGEGRPLSPTFSTGRSGRIHRYYVAADLQLGQERLRSDHTIRRVGADALEGLITSEVARISGRRELGPSELQRLLLRLELRPGDTQLLLDRDALFGLDHPELALDELKGRLAPGERVVVEPGRLPTLRILLPRRMQLRGGRTWILVDGDQPNERRPDPVLIEGLRRAHLLLQTCADRRPASIYERRLVKLAFLSPELQRMIFDGRQPSWLTLAELFRADLPLCWAEQRRWVKRLA